MFWSFLGFSVFTSIIFGGGSRRSQADSPAPKVQLNSTQVPFTNGHGSIEETYAPYYTPNGRGSSIFGKVEIRNSKNEIVHE